jgi:hypothetical protein
VIRRSLVLCLALLLAPQAAHAQAISGVAASTAGHLAFVNDRGSDGAWMLRVVSPDGQVSAPEQVNPTFDEPWVAIGARGDAIVAWFDDGRLLARFRPPAGPLGPVEEVAPKASFGVEAIPLGVDAAGNAFAGWSASDEDGMHMRMRDAATGAWGADQPLGGSQIYDPDLAVADNGTAVLAWRQHGGHGLNSRQIAVSARGPGGTFGPGNVVAGVAHHADEPTIALNDRGDAAVLWNELHGDFSVHGIFRAAGGSFGRSMRLSHIHAGGPWVSVQPDGRMVMAWTEYTNRRVEARVRSAAGRLGRAFILTHDVGVNSSAVALPTAGGAVAWIDRDPGVVNIRIARATPALRFGPPALIQRVRGYIWDPAFAATATSLAVVPDPPLRAENPIHWRRVSVG